MTSVRVEVVACGVPSQLESGHRVLGTTPGVSLADLDVVERRSTASRPMTGDEAFKLAVSSYLAPSGRWVVMHQRPVRTTLRGSIIEARSYLIEATDAAILRWNPFAFGRALRRAKIDEGFGTARVEALSVGVPDDTDDPSALDALAAWGAPAIIDLLTRVWSAEPVAAISERPVPRFIEGILGTLGQRDRRRLACASYYSTESALAYDVYQTSDIKLVKGTLPRIALVGATSSPTQPDPTVSWWVDTWRREGAAFVRRWIELVDAYDLTLALPAVSWSALRRLHSAAASTRLTTWRSTLALRCAETLLTRDHTASVAMKKVAGFLTDDAVPVDDRIRALVEEARNPLCQARMAEHLAAQARALSASIQGTAWVRLVAAFADDKKLAAAMLSERTSFSAIPAPESRAVLSDLLRIVDRLGPEAQRDGRQLVTDALAALVAIDGQADEVLLRLFEKIAPSTSRGQLTEWLTLAESRVDGAVAWRIFAGPVSTRLMADGEVLEHIHAERILRQPEGIGDIAPIVSARPGSWACLEAVARAILEETSPARRGAQASALLRLRPRPLVSFAGETSPRLVHELLLECPDAELRAVGAVDLIRELCSRAEPRLPRALATLWADVEADPAVAGVLRREVYPSMWRLLQATPGCDLRGYPAVLAADLADHVIAELREPAHRRPDFDAVAAVRATADPDRGHALARAAIVAGMRGEPVPTMAVRSNLDALRDAPAARQRLAADLALASPLSFEVGSKLAKVGGVDDLLVSGTYRWPADADREAIHLLLQITWPVRPPDWHAEAAADLAKRCARATAPLSWWLARYDDVAKCNAPADAPTKALREAAVRARAAIEALRPVERDAGWATVLQRACEVSGVRTTPALFDQGAYPPPQIFLWTTSPDLLAQTRAAFGAHRLPELWNRRAAAQALMGLTPPAPAYNDPIAHGAAEVVVSWRGVGQVKAPPSAKANVVLIHARQPGVAKQFHDWLEGVEAIDRLTVLVAGQSAGGDVVDQIRDAAKKKVGWWGRVTQSAEVLAVDDLAGALVVVLQGILDKIER